MAFSTDFEIVKSAIASKKIFVVHFLSMLFLKVDKNVNVDS